MTRITRFALLLSAAAILLPSAAFAQGEFSYPCSGTVTGETGEWRGDHAHAGLDIANNSGTKIHVARGGTITFAGWSGGYGNLAIINHSYSYQTYYAHNSSFYRTGGNVERGWTVAYMGSTGNSSGPHSHFEIRRFGGWQEIPGRRGAWVSDGAAIPKDYPVIHN